MHKAQKEMKFLPKIDLFIEVLDARIPFSSQNPMIRQLRGDKPCIKVLSKTDLADPLLTNQWQTYLEQEQGVRALPITIEQTASMQQLLPLCRQMFPARDKTFTTINTLIAGIPNVGKSTLINHLAGRIIAKTGNEPAVTKIQQRIQLDEGVVLFDTPGILWPKIENEHSSYRLAASGAIRDTAMDYIDVAFYAAKYLIKAYPRALAQRFGLKRVPDTELEFLELVGAKRGCLRSGGQVDLNKVSDIFINELRAGTLGRITLETPGMIEHEEQEIQAKRIQKEADKQARKQRFKDGGGSKSRKTNTKDVTASAKKPSKPPFPKKPSRR